MVGFLVNNEFVRMLKEAVVVYVEVLQACTWRDWGISQKLVRCPHRDLRRDSSEQKSGVSAWANSSSSNISSSSSSSSGGGGVIAVQTLDGLGVVINNKMIRSPRNLFLSAGLYFVLSSPVLIVHFRVTDGRAAWVRRTVDNADVRRFQTVRRVRQDSGTINGIDR